MATILKGAPVVAAMNERNAALCEQLKAKGITPTLAVVRVGERESALPCARKRTSTALRTVRWPGCSRIPIWATRPAPRRPAWKF